MAEKTDAPPGKNPLSGLFRLQQRLVVRTSGYLRRLGDLASQGSIEPREYIEESFNLWSGVLEEIGDWVSPSSLSDFGGHFPVSRVEYQMRPERGDFAIEVPVEVFDRLGEDAVVLLSTDGLIRRFDPKNSLRPTVVFAPEYNVRVEPPKIRREQRNAVELKVFGLPPTISPDEKYAALVWGATESAPQRRFPVAVVELTIV